MDQRNSLKDWEEFNEKSKPRTKGGKYEKEILLKVYMFFMKVEN